jgi:hypothetical protein
MKIKKSDLKAALSEQILHTQSPLRFQPFDLVKQPVAIKTYFQSPSDARLHIFIKALASFHARSNDICRCELRIKPYGLAIFMHHGFRLAEQFMSNTSVVMCNAILRG